jgi:hypothetical protein
LSSKDKTKSSREGFQRGGIFYRKGRWRGCRSYRSHETHGGHDDNQNSFLRGCGRSRGRGRGRWSWRYDILEIKCYNCKEFGHYASNCHCTTIGEDKLKGEFCYEEPALLLACGNFESCNRSTWYLDTGVSNRICEMKFYWAWLRKLWQHHLLWFISNTI